MQVFTLRYWSETEAAWATATVVAESTAACMELFLDWLLVNDPQGFQYLMDPDAEAQVKKSIRPLTTIAPNVVVRFDLP